MGGAGKIRAEEDKFAAKRRVEAKPPQDAVDGDVHQANKASSVTVRAHEAK